MSRTEFKIIKESENWVIIYKYPKVHSDSIELRRGASSPAYRAVHRLDLETQGLLLLSTEKFWPFFHEIIKKPSTKKIYLAGSTGLKLPLGLHEGFIGARYRSSKKVLYSPAKEALRGYHSIQEASLIVKKGPKAGSPLSGHPFEVELISGRRHQIRSFFAFYKAPLYNDPIYGSSKKTQESLALLSWKLNFMDPICKEEVSAEAPFSLFC